MLVHKISALIEKISELAAAAIGRRSNQDISTAILDQSEPESANSGETGSSANGIAVLVLPSSSQLLQVSIEFVLLSLSRFLGVVSHCDSCFFLKKSEAVRGGHGSRHTLSHHQDISGVDH